MPRGIPKPRKGKGMYAWRSRQPKGAIMKPETFDKIVAAAQEKYHISKERGKKVAGKAYKTTLKKKYAEAKR